MMMDDGEAARAAQLYDEGAAMLEAAWDDAAGLLRRDTPYGAFHDGRGSLAYADVLLRRAAPADVDRAARIIDIVSTMQERREQDAHYGNFRWFFEDEGVTDLNAVEFALDSLITLAIDHAETLPEAALAQVREMIALGLDAIDRLDVHPSYTNIALSDICNSILGGETLDEAAYIDRGRRRLDEWWEYTNRSGAPHEYNSPTYIAVDIARMACLAEHTRDATIALKARMAEERLWLHVAAHYHPQLAQLAGPHSRSYRDGWTGAGGYLKLMLWRLLGDDNLRRPTPYFPRGREEGHTGVASAPLHCPPYVVAWLRDRAYPYGAIETADAATGTDLTTYMTPHTALGTATASYGVGEPREPWPAFNSILLHFAKAEAPGYGTLFARYIINDKGVGAVMHESDRNNEDHWDEGKHAGAQHRNRAIVAYGLVPRMRPVKSYKLSVRMLGLADAPEIWLGGVQVRDFPAPVAPGEPIVIAAGHAYVAIIPLEPSDMGSDAPIELRLDDGMLVLDIYNYRGPAKTFWEHRSQAGPFYKGNVRNAFIVEAVDTGSFPSLDAFRAHIAAARIADSVDDAYVREIVYASDGGSIALRYSLWDMRVAGRAFDGVPFLAPMARAGTIGGAGAQFTQSRDSLIEVAGVRLMAGRTPKWLFADEGSGQYVFANPSDESAPVWLETPATVVDCEEFGFGRIVIDERAGSVEVEVAGDIAPVRVRRDGALKLAINGADVTPALTAPDAEGWREFRGL